MHLSILKVEKKVREKSRECHNPVVVLTLCSSCSFVVPAVFSVFSICVVMLALWSPSSIASHFAF